MDAIISDRAQALRRQIATYDAGNPATNKAGQLLPGARTELAAIDPVIIAANELLDAIVREKKAVVSAGFAELTQEEALDTIAVYLTGRGLPYKIWTGDDIRSLIENEYDDALVERIVDEAQGTRYWHNLADTTDRDWEYVSLAVYEAVALIKEETE